jgi:hypothetical protein
MRVAYTPVPGIRADLSDSAYNIPDLIPFSQKLGAWMFPQDNQGCEIELPFFYHKNWIRLNIASEAVDLGQLDFIRYSLLRNANGIASGNVHVHVYGWMENVTVSSTTVGLSVQALDEYEEMEGVISKPASVVAGIAAQLKRFELIRPFARATEVAARAGADVAHMMGYTNVPNLNATDSMKPAAYPQFATCDISTPIEKLSVDPKQEVTLDSRTVGLSGVDELEIASLIQRESYLSTLAYNIAAVENELLYTVEVSPMMMLLTAAPSQSILAMTPMAYVAQMFNYWRGDVIFRFRIICSKFHRGRLRISFDPQGELTNNLQSVADTTQTAFTRIIDISEETDVEIRVPFAQAQNWQQVPPHETYWSLGTRAFTFTGNQYRNGTLTVRVLNALSSPSATGDVSVLVSARAGENMLFAAPAEIDQRMSVWEVQSAETALMTSSSASLGTTSSLASGDLCSMSVGEQVLSLRQLLHRTSYSDSVGSSILTSAVNTIATNVHIHGRLPPWYGYNPNGYHVANGLISGTPTAFTYAKTTPITLVGYMFAGYRGSVNWTYDVSSSSDNRESIRSWIRVYRLFNTHTVGNWYGTASGDFASLSKCANQCIQQRSTGSTGQSLTAQQTQHGLAVQWPYYNRFNMVYLNKNNILNGNSADDSDRDALALEVDLTSVAVMLQRGQ